MLSSAHISWKAWEASWTACRALERESCDEGVWLDGPRTKTTLAGWAPFNGASITKPGGWNMQPISDAVAVQKTWRGDQELRQRRSVGPGKA